MSPRRLTKMAKALKTAREKRDLTQEELAKRSRVSQSMISALETATLKNPSLQTLKRLASALDVPLTELVD